MSNSSLKAVYGTHADATEAATGSTILARRWTHGVHLLRGQRVGWLLLALLCILAPSPASAQIRGQVPILVEGVWDLGTDDAAVIGQLTFIDDKGGQKRTLGVTSAQAYDPPEEGMAIFRQAEIQPGYVVFGRETEISAFFGAPAGKTVKAKGIYWANNGNFMLGAVEVLDRPSTKK